MRRVLLLVSIIFFSFFVTKSVQAADFRNDYKVDYFLSDNGNTVNSHVKFAVTITYNRSDIFIKNLTLSFPKSFGISNVLATDNSGTLATTTTDDNSLTKIAITFENPTSGKNNNQMFYVEFDQDNLFRVDGNIWEVTLPIISDEAKGDYQIQVHLPDTSNKKISIAKPVPDNIQGDVITWNNPQAKTVYAAFGNSQYYQVNLTYHLRNAKLTPVYTEVAFPPDTLYQKIYLQSVVPPPDKVYQDEDGNYIGRYNLNPAEKKDIQFKSVIEILAKPRDEVRAVQAKILSAQRKYLTSETTLWQIPELPEFNSLTTPQAIYSYVVGKLQYDFDKLDKTSVPRMGAAAILRQPDQAVCTEFADLFIALAREKGNYAREVEGYGFSQDQYLQPQTKNADILHSWPEYYDSANNLWKPVDPTWENTSGIDYFSSFDFNHLVFAIHGKDPEYPLAAGMYKFNNTHDIDVQPTKEVTTESIHLSLQNPKMPSIINDRQHYHLSLIVSNGGNTYAWNVPLSIQTKGIIGSQRTIVIDSLAPMEQKEYIYDYYAQDKNKQDKGEIKINLLNNEVFSQSFSIVPYYYSLGLKIVYIVIPVSILFLALKLLLKKRH